MNDSDRLAPPEWFRLGNIDPAVARMSRIVTIRVSRRRVQVSTRKYRARKKRH